MDYPKAGSIYGSMGRREDKPSRLVPIKARLVRVPLNSGGYDPGGAYWGIGKPLYTVRAECEEYDGYEWYFRADSRAQAEWILTSEFPLATFRRLTPRAGV